MVTIQPNVPITHAENTCAILFTIAIGKDPEIFLLIPVFELLVNSSIYF